MQLECHLFYRNAEDDENDWKELASAVVERRLDCRIDENQVLCISLAAVSFSKNVF